MRVVHYVTPEGIDPFDRWLRRQNAEVRARVQIRIDRIEMGNFGDHHSVGSGVSELRLDFGPGYRVYYGRDGADLVVLLGGGDKGRQRRDIRQAQAYWNDYRKEQQHAGEAHNASDYLDTPEAVAAYLNAALEEMDDDPRLLMKAFRNVAEARGGITRLAATANLDRVALSRALSGQRNPRLDTITKVSAACGVKLRFTA